jgi:TrmH family RNA methyltransferase
MTRFSKRITSRQNDTVAHYRAAARGDETEWLLLDGEHLIGDAAAAGLRLHHVMVTSDPSAALSVSPLLDRLSRDHVPIAEASPAVMAAISPVRTPSPVVALAVRPGERSPFRAQPPLVAIACDVQDPGNIGAIVRVAEAAGATGLIAAGRCANPFGWKALRGSMGSALRLPISITPRLDDGIAEARRNACRIVATVPSGGDAPFRVDLRGPVAVLIGGEGRGLSETLVQAADDRMTIPMQAPVESLNAAVTAALVLYEARRQRETRL